MATLEQVVQELQARLIGSWHGRARLWFEPGHPAFDETAGDGLVVRHHNVSPAGEEALAVQFDYERR